MENNIIQRAVAKLLKDDNHNKYNEMTPILRQANILDWRDAMEAMAMFGKSITPDFTIDKDNRFVYENLAKWLVSEPSFQACGLEKGSIVQGSLRKGLYIAGGTGSGKTTALEVLRKCSEVIGAKFKYMDSTYDLFGDGYLATSICDNYAISGEITDYKKQRALVIQDVGAEPIETQYMGNRQNVIKSIIEARGDSYGMITYITSNYMMNGSNMVERYGDRVTSRLVQMCNFLYLGGKDRRK